MKVVVGLGNPGVRFRWSRHNIGFQVADLIAERNQISLSHRRFKALYGIGSIHSQPIVLAKPMTFMNLSGEAVRDVVRYFSAELKDLIVIHDDLDLPFGKLRVKRMGGDGGHQGVRSVIEAVGGSHFLRLKVGIGRPPDGMEAAEYVLDRFRETEKSEIDKMLGQAVEVVTVMILEGVDKAISQCQRKAIPPSQSP